MSSSRPLAGAVLAALALLAPAAAADARPIAQKQFVTQAAGEARLALTAAAPGTDWGVAGRESAVVSVSVDGRYSQDVVLFAGAERFTYDVALGRLERGRHNVTVAFDADKSSSGAMSVMMFRMAARMSSLVMNFSVLFLYST